MQTPTRPFPPALPHGELREVLPNTFLVTGTVRLPGAMPVRFSRNMTVVRDGERLVLVNSVRLDEAGLAALDRLGKVTDVVRLAGFHGMDDPFYKDRYGAKVWALRGQRYTSGFAPGGEPYFAPDVEMDARTTLPLEGARLYVIDATHPRSALRERAAVAWRARRRRCARALPPCDRARELRLPSGRRQAAEPRPRAAAPAAIVTETPSTSARASSPG